MCAELRRVLSPGAPLLLAFQLGDGAPHRLTQAYGHAVDLTVFRHDLPHVQRCLAGAALSVTATTVRAPVPPESTPQAHVTAVRS